MYQWYKTTGVGAGLILGATNPTYTIPAAASAHGGSYLCVVSNPGDCGYANASNTVTLTVSTGPQITSQPTELNLCSGGTGDFSVIATGSGLTYQWRYDGSAIEDNASALTATLTLTNAQYSSVGAYDCVVASDCGSTTSDPAPLSICPGDFNCDGGIDGADLEAFFAEWESGDPAADLNEDGGIDGADVEFFFAHWEGGC